MTWHEGDVVRKLRSSVNWTLQDLATNSGVNVQVIHRLESGKTRDPKRRTLERVAAAFGVTIQELRNAVPPPSLLKASIKATKTGRPRPATDRRVHAGHE